MNGFEELGPPGSRDDGESVEVDRVALAGRAFRARIATVASIAFIALAFVKPWQSPGAATASPPPEPTAAPVAAVSIQPIQPAPLIAVQADPCPQTPGWVVVDDDTTGSFATRTWTLAEITLRATSPSDTEIPFTRIVTPQMRDLGFCSPVRGPGSGGWSGTLWTSDTPAAAASPWRAVAHYTVAGRLSQLLAAADGPPLSEHASPSGFGASWPPGLYVLQVQALDRSSSMWLGIELDIAP